MNTTNRSTESRTQRAESQVKPNHLNLRNKAKRRLIPLDDILDSTLLSQVKEGLSDSLSWDVKELDFLLTTEEGFVSAKFNVNLEETDGMQGI